MPEWPDLHVLRARLERALVGRRVTGVRVGDPVVLRSTRPAKDVLFGRTFHAVEHRGKFLRFDLDGAAMVVNPMLAGLFQLVSPGAKLTKDTRLALALDDGTELRYRDGVRMGKVYLLEGGEDPRLAVPGFADVRPAPLEIGDLSARARSRGGDVRGFLMDQRAIAGIGNAYADEILWEARLHPKRSVRSLSAAELGALENAIAKVITRGVDEVEAGLPPELGTKVRGHMRVRGREGEPCARCGGAIKRTRKGDDETYLCTACQPPPAGVLR